MTINDIQSAMREAGSHWWDPDTMRMFGTRVCGAVFTGSNGVYFVTSEWDGFRGKEEGRRAYTVRHYKTDSRDIDTVGSIGDYASRAKALRAARKEAGEAIVADESKLRPITTRQQFIDDCHKHGNPEASATDCDSLMKSAFLHHRLMEQYCNGRELYDADGEPKQALRNARKKIQRIAQAVGATGVVFSGDPRGCTVKLTWKDGATDDWGHEGWCVPTE